jgi:hypothetical protein
MRILVAIFIGWLLIPSFVIGQNKSYQFDGKGITREVLENYLTEQ